MDDPTSFTDDENWIGGFYELAIELGHRDDDRLDAAVAAAWSDSRLVGPFPHGDREATEQTAVEPTLASQEMHGHLRGLADLPTGSTVVCGSVVVREEGGTDWFDLYLPLGALARADGRVGAYPFGATAIIGNETATRNSLDWRLPIDRWLTGIAARIYERVPFRLGLIGFEASGATSAEELDAVPNKRYMTYLVPGEGTLRSYEATI